MPLPLEWEVLGSSHLHSGQYQQQAWGARSTEPERWSRGLPPWLCFHLGEAAPREQKYRHNMTSCLLFGKYSY
jgi:hypothetical protein